MSRRVTGRRVAPGAADMSLDRPGDEIPQGDPWTVRLPTTLVRLRPDDKLPKWEQNAEGEWVEA